MILPVVKINSILSYCRLCSLLDQEIATKTTQRRPHTIFWWKFSGTLGFTRYTLAIPISFVPQATVSSIPTLLFLQNSKSTREVQRMHAAFTRCLFANSQHNGRCSRMLWLSWSCHSIGTLTIQTFMQHIIFLLEDCRRFSFLLLLFLLYVPQGDAFQMETKVSHCIADCLLNRRLEGSLCSVP